MRPLSPSDGMQRKWRDGRPMQKVAAGFIKPNDRLTSFERLEIYNRQYWYRLRDCFYDDYPGLRAILGQRRFEKMAEAYLTRHPSTSFTLRNLGRYLVEFLKAEPKWIKPLTKPALDMARLEWAHIEAFDNPARPTLEMDSLLGADPARVYLQLQPHLALLELGYELDEFLIQIKRTEREREETSNAMAQQPARRKKLLTRHLRAKRIQLAVHRHNNMVFYKRLLPAQFQLLTAFRQGESLAEACEKLAATGQTDFNDVQAWFKSWAALGWFCKLDE